MNTLPPELVKLIATFLDDKPDVKNFRLVSRTYARLMEENLFQRLYISPSLQSLTRFRVFCRTQGYLTRFVKEVVMVLSNWENLIWQPFLRILRFNRIRLNDGHELEASIVLRKMLSRYFQFLQSPFFMKILSLGFQCLQGLRTITIQRDAIHDDDDDEIGFAHDKIGHICDDGGHALWRRANNYGLDLQSLGNAICIAWPHSDGFRTFSALIDAAYHSGTEIHTWKIDSMVRIEPGILSNEALLQRAASVFSKCRSLRLDIYLGGIPEAGIIDRMVHGDFRHALESATYLSKLEISSDNLMTIPLEVLLGTYHSWEHLKELRMTSACFGAMHFQKFLRRHRSTLRLVWFRRCRLSTGSWLGSEGLKFWLDDFYLPHLKLKVFQIRWLFEPDGSYAGNIIRGSLANYQACQT